MVVAVQCGCKPVILARLVAAIVLCVFGVQLRAQDGDEHRHLQQALAEAGSSTVDFIRALEGHLALYPESSRRAEVERALAKAALETNDNPRIVQYGERVIAAEEADLQLMERVARALLASNDKESAERALKHARRYEQGIREFEQRERPARLSPARRREEIDRGLGRALVLQSRAVGNLGRLPEALALARRSYETYPTAESAREIGRWLSRSGKEEEAVPHYADAFTIPDPRTQDSDRAGDRARMGELYRRLKGSEAGLGDLILEAYDRTTTLVNERQFKLRQLDPNAQAKNPMEFTLSGFLGDRLAMSSLKGKVLVLDFWATWCGPCRIQHHLYKQVKERFGDRDDLVFLAINTDEDRSVVGGFLEENKWDKRVYFEDGLAAALQISSIPTTILINKRGEIHSRMNGFIPERFVDMLSERIEQALNQ